jgi:hypothetical protein
VGGQPAVPPQLELAAVQWRQVIVARWSRPLSRALRCLLASPSGRLWIRVPIVHAAWVSGGCPRWLWRHSALLARYLRATVETGIWCHPAGARLGIASVLGAVRGPDGVLAMALSEVATRTGEGPAAGC